MFSIPVRASGLLVGPVFYTNASNEIYEWNGIRWEARRATGHFKDLKVIKDIQSLKGFNELNGFIRSNVLEDITCMSPSELP